MFEFLYESDISKRKIFTIFLVILMIANIIAAVVIFLDIQLMEAPRTDVEFKVVDITADELTLQLRMEVYNPNSFDLSIDDFKVISKTEKGDTIGELSLDGGSISASKTKVFRIDDKLKFSEDSDFKILYNKITGKIGVNFLGFVKKTIPIELNVKTSVEEIIENIKVPDIDLEFILDNLVEEGIEFTVGVNVNNPNNIGISINEFTLNAVDDEDEDVGSFTISGGEINPNGESYFDSTGVLLYKFVDTQKLDLKLYGDASVNIAGMDKSLSLSTDMSVVLPDIQEFIFQNENIKFFIPVQFKLRLNGIRSTVGFKYYNPSNVTLVARNLNCSIYRVDGDDKSLLGIKEMDSCVIDPREEVCLKTEILIPYIDFLRAGNYRLLPNWIVLTIEGDFAIAGTRQAVPLSLNAYVNPNLFKNQEFIE